MTDEWKGASFKQVEDHSADASALLERINSTTIRVLLRGTNDPVDHFLDELLTLEKRSRLGGDVPTTQRLAVEVIRILRVLGEFDKMLSMLDSLMKRRAQSKTVQCALIGEAAAALQEESLASEVKYQLLTKLTLVTEGKLHVELEHARFVSMLADVVEAEGRKREAFDMLQQVQVESITNMPRLEKLGSLNRQMRLCLELGEFLKIPLISRKINFRALNRPDTISIKLEYFELMRQYYACQEQHLLMARCWFETLLTVTDDDAKLAALSNMAVLVFISEHLTQREVDDAAECAAFSPATKLLDRDHALKVLLEQRRLEHELTTLHNIATAFTSVALIRIRVAPEIDELCGSHPLLAEREDRQLHFRNRASEHDLLVVAKYYTRVRTARLSKLVGLTPEHTERFVMSLVANKTIYAKMDRIEGVIVFQRAKRCADVVTQWNDSVTTCVNLIDRAAHLVVKERMLHNHPVAAAAAQS